jgi:hypothetical protein
MASLSNRDIARVVTKGGTRRLSAKNVVSAIASEFGAALHGLSEHDYLRGAWIRRTMTQLRGTFEEHDWSEILTGVYYDLLQYLYVRNVAYLERTEGKKRKTNMREYYAMRALSNAATVAASVMFRGLDYCPPVDLRYDQYASAVIRADEVAYPFDDRSIRKAVRRFFALRQIVPVRADVERLARIKRALLGVDVAGVASAPADAYRFLDGRRDELGIPYDANFRVQSVYRTSKLSKDGYRPPREHIIEYLRSEDVELKGPRFGDLSGTFLPLFCGGTLVFDSNGNCLHVADARATERRRQELRQYAAYLVAEGQLRVADGIRGIGAPGRDAVRIHATVEGGRVKLIRNAAMRHVPEEAVR